VRKRAAVALLHSLRNRAALAKNPLVAEIGGDELNLPNLVESLVDELCTESSQQRRRFGVLRRSDIQREKHVAIARDMGLSRSQFYRDLSDARERFTQALEDRLSLQTPAEYDPVIGGGDATTFAAIDALRDAGRFKEAHRLAGTVARDRKNSAHRIRALCLRAGLEIELGQFEKAESTTTRARTLISDIVDDRLRGLFEATCDLADHEAAHCQGRPATAAMSNRLIDRLRAAYHPHDRAHATLLTKALVAEASVLFEQDEAARALAAVDEATSVVERARLGGTRVAVDVEIRASGIRALHPDQVSVALDATAKIVEMGNRKSDVRTLRLGLQMMAAHLLTLGRLDEARRFALQARALIELFGSPLDRLIVLSNLARIDIHRQDGKQALRWIDLARTVPCQAFSIVQALQISRAEALVLVGQPDRAVALTRSIGERVGAWPRLLARAKLAEATALSVLERVREAQVCSEEAVAFSHGTAGPLLHLRALVLNVKLTGSAGSKAALRDLKTALSA
jgi:tetratricopeptide (TPR) repeat protein